MIVFFLSFALFFFSSLWFVYECVLFLPTSFKKGRWFPFGLGTDAEVNFFSSLLLLLLAWKEEENMWVWCRALQMFN
jgi:hypothetical protein